MIENKTQEIGINSVNLRVSAAGGWAVHLPLPLGHSLYQYIGKSKLKGIIKGQKRCIRQGRIQDLSEGEQDFLGTKKLIMRNKNRVACENFFDLKYSKRVKIYD